MTFLLYVAEKVLDGLFQQPVRRLPAAPATATAATAAAKATAAGALGLGTGLVHVQRATLKVLLVHAVDRRLGLGLGRHLDEPEAARLAAELVFKNRGLLNLPVGAESVPQVLFRDVTGQITDKDIHRT